MFKIMSLKSRSSVTCTLVLKKISVMGILSAPKESIGTLPLTKIINNIMSGDNNARLWVNECCETAFTREILA